MIACGDGAGIIILTITTTVAYFLQFYVIDLKTKYRYKVTREIFDIDV